MNTFETLVRFEIATLGLIAMAVALPLVALTRLVYWLFDTPEFSKSEDGDFRF